MPNIILQWDFDAFRELFATGPIAHLQRSPPAPTEWTDEARAAFTEAFADDLRIWRDGVESSPGGGPAS